MAIKFYPIVIFIITLTMQTADASPGGLVIDAGHSPKTQGAMSCTGKPEYLYNSDLTETILAYLSKRNLSATLTHEMNQEISLVNRAKTASGKILFLSIHHDSVQPQFITWKKRRPFSTKAEGYSIFVSTKSSYYLQSLEYARRLGTSLRSKGLKPSQHHAEKIAGENRFLIDPELGIYIYDDLVVLKNTDAPAVLFEAAVIVNPKDELKATSASYKTLICEAIAETVTCDSVPPRNDCGKSRSRQGTSGQSAADHEL